MKLLSAYLVGGPLAVLVALGFLVYGEHAVVKVTVTAQRLQVANVPLAGGADTAGLATQQISASASEQQMVASGVVQLPARPATGLVSFMCSPMTSCPNGYTVVAGTLLKSTSGAEYRTLSTASFPSCAWSSPVGVAALTAGAAGNAAPGALVFGRFPSYVHVDNALAIAGGTDPHSAHLVQQSDVNAASSVLTARVSAELNSKLQTRAGSLSFVTAGAPAFSTTSSARAGDSAATFTVTVTGTIHAIAYSASDAGALLRGALSQRVAPGYRLTTAPIDATYSMQPGGLFTGSAAAYEVPSVDPGALAAALRGQSLSEATSRIDQSVPNGAAGIQVTPFAVPWLPMLSDHISVVVVTRPAA